VLGTAPQTDALARCTASPSRSDAGSTAGSGRKGSSTGSGRSSRPALGAAGS